MSTFMIDEDQYSKLRNIFVAVEHMSKFSVLWPLVRISKQMLCNEYDVSERTIRALVYLNARGSGEHPKIALHAYRYYKLKRLDLSADQTLETDLVLKVHYFLSCVIYQCSESAVLDNPKREAFLNSVKEFNKNLADAYVFEKASKRCDWANL